MRTVSRGAVPALTTEQIRAVDRAMVEDLHIELVQMMENAGRNLAELAMTRFSPTSVTVLAGPGGNGGAGGVASQAVTDQGVDDQAGGGRPAGKGDAHPGEDVGLVGGHRVRRSGSESTAWT
jgi:NAD(P)H-hydrate epimerase